MKDPNWFPETNFWLNKTNNRFQEEYVCLLKQQCCGNKTYNSFNKEEQNFLKAERFFNGRDC
jgi:hypothetical protein